MHTANCGHTLQSREEVRPPTSIVRQFERVERLDERIKDGKPIGRQVVVMLIRMHGGRVLLLRHAGQSGDRD